ncbi:unnamed protein product [Cyclocybe aegerita]|uniref:Pre-SET domain-containing protein n=1 Tax=Cyclocybe aegerita TaxID=1973307 RepID=A0A8S0XH96_CYCAE|nr:unnamed protein product [Cyclocybe aegerita]
MYSQRIRNLEPSNSIEIVALDGIEGNIGMNRERPSPPPLPRWEAIHEPPPSGDEEDEDEEDELLSSSSHQTPAPVNPVLKRKESDWSSQSIPKRPKHSQPTPRSEPGGSRGQAESVSAPVRQTNGSRPPYPSTSFSSTFIPGASKGAAPSLTAPSTSSQSVPSMLPPPLPSRNISSERRPSSEAATNSQASSSSRNTDQSSTRKPTSTSTSIPRPRPISKKNIPSSLPRELFSAAVSSSRKALSANTSAKPKPKPNSKPMPSNEIIEISDDEPSPPGPKKSLPPSEIIEIFDSSDEESAVPPARGSASQSVPSYVPTGPPRRTKASVNEERVITSASRSSLSQKDRNGDRMDVDIEPSTLQPSKTSLLQPALVPTIPMKPTDEDQCMVVDRIKEPPDSTLSATRIPSTPTSASFNNNKDEVRVKNSGGYTPSSVPRRMSTGSPKSAAKKPVSREGLTPISAPPSASTQPSPSKPRLQRGLKSASATFRPPEEASLPSPSNSSSEARASSRRMSHANSDDAGIDMRNLNEALGLGALSSRQQTPENPVTVKPQPISPEMPKPSTARNLMLERPKFVARKSSGGRIPAPQIPLREPGTADMPIDLTSDNEDVGPEDAVMEKARESAKTLVKLVADLKGKKLEAFTPPSKQQPSTNALLHEPYASSSRASASTDELALRSAGVSASPPPRSVSPQFGSPGIPVATKSSEVQNEARRNSAPSLGKEPVSRVIRSSSPLSRPVTSPRSPLTKRPEARPFLSASMPQVPTALSSLAKSATSLQSAAQSASSSHSLPATVPTLRYTPTSSVSTPSVSPVRATQAAPVAPTENIVQETSHAVVTKLHAPQTVLDPAAIAAQLPSGTLSEDEATEVQQLIAETDDEIEDVQTKDDALMDVDSDEEMPPEASVDANEGSEMGDAPEDDVPDSNSLDDLALPRDPVDPTGRTDTPSDGEDSCGSSASLPPGRRRSSRRSSHSSSDNGSNEVFDDDFGLSVSAPASRSTTPEDIVLDVVPKKSYGGFAAVTWAEYRKDPNNFRPKVYRARDLPHTLQDHVNRMVNSQETPHGARELFEAMISENTADDEPLAPHIRVENDVDDEATPPWEFYYSNKMWHGEGVPDPDIKGLLSCDCRGWCNPKSKTCACLKRQRDAVKDKDLVVEFAYDKNGKLKIAGYPVFECNELCGCSEECRNRVVQHGRKVEVHIRKTESKGWGVFAGDKKIPQGTFIVIYQKNSNKFGHLSLLLMHIMQEISLDIW